MPQYNKRAGSVKRLLKEAQELEADPSPEFKAAPQEDDLFDWHFTIRVPHEDFKGGAYHGRLLLPQNYPLAPPDVMLMTPNGRFELNKKICLSITGYHAETWQPAWGIRTAMLALISFFESEGKGALGALDTPSAERRKLALHSRDWKCSTCGVKNSELLSPADEEKETESASAEAGKPNARMTDAVSNSETAAELAPTFRQPQAETSPDLFRTATTPITVAERPTVWIDRLIAVLVLGLAVLVLRKLQSGSAQVVSGITKDMAR